jgi:hypothetical protein
MFGIRYADVCAFTDASVLVVSVSLRWALHMMPFKGNGCPVLYLDFDGTLHHESVWWHPRRGAYLIAPPRYKLFQHTGLLEEMLAPYPNVAIVLSTNWTRRYGFSKVAKRLPTGLRHRVVGATYHSQMADDAFDLLPRWAQVIGDVHRRRPASWLAIDDDHIGWPVHLAKHLVVTDPYEGIGLPEVQAKLRGCLELLARLELPCKETKT